MRQFEHYELEKDGDEYTLVIYLDNFHQEFSKDLDKRTEITNNNLFKDIKNFIKEKFPNLKIKAVKLMIGATLISAIPLGSVLAATDNTSSSYTVQSGDSLWKIANRFGVSVSELKNYNRLTSDTLYVGQTIRIPTTSSMDVTININGQVKEIVPEPMIIDGTTYIPIRAIANSLGATVWWNESSNTVGINRDDIKIAFVIGSNTARVNGNKITISPAKIMNGTTYVPIRFISETFGYNVNWDAKTRTVNITTPKQTTYTVVSGDTLWKIASRFGTSVLALKQINNLTSDRIHVGQKLTIPTVENTATQNKGTQETYTKPTVTYITHTVSKGDNLWDLSIRYGIPFTELLSVNKLTQNSTLTLGQKLTIPVHHIPVKPVVSEKHGELLDWWTEAQYVFPIGKVAKVTDFQTGRTWYVKRTIGANHADSEPLTAKDAAIIKEVWGGTYNWNKRAIIIEVDGRRIAASMTSMPHDIQYIKDNNYNGHFDIHFLNSTRHKDGKMTESHQKQVRIAAGVESL
ncbi:LysM peptidoglycan-binding domain-containing protein [Vulcanibacillus modesticaldus]|uniref:LysM peptidoglycan-binding domain-containing protein n=1 Tax=Vulcanibacillus modesticaldus TaxID=337097 RepID=UPI000A4BD78B|nr:LysM peptidoglycan-binding domain-containing protein [Vulcanibacillus modesticaldus]